MLPLMHIAVAAIAMHIAVAAMLLLLLFTAWWLLVLLGQGWASDQRGEVTVVTLVSTQVLHRKYASCCTVVITSSCQDAECIPGLNFSTYTVVCCTSKICSTSV